MPKSKHNRKGKSRGGDKRPVARSGRNEGPVDFRSAQPPLAGKGEMESINNILNEK